MAASGLPLLDTFQKHIEDMRNLSLCKICIKPFYEPFVLGCGHTYCYSCLASWFNGAAGRKKSRNCPDCRAEVKTQPAPNYLLRDLVHMFIGRTELLPEDESIEEHQKGKEEEAALLAADRAGLGVFKGAFLRQNHSIVRWGRGLLDPGDNVLRCPECHWELEHGECLQCGFHEYASDDSMDNESELTTDDDQSHVTIETDQDANGNPFYIPGLAPGLNGLGGLSPSAYSTYTVEEDDLYDQDDDIDGFIDNEADEVDDEDDAEFERYERWRRADGAAAIPQHPGAPITLPRFFGIGDSGDFANQPDDGVMNYQENSEVNTDFDEESEVQTNYDEESEVEAAEEDEQVPIRNRSRVQRVVISDSESEGDSDDDDEEDDEVGSVRTITRQQSADGGSSDDTSDSNSPSYSNSSLESASEQGDSAAESEDSVRPPQGAVRRRQHLQNQRARRDGEHFQSHTQNQRAAISNRAQDGQSTYRGGFNGSRGNNNYQRHPYARTGTANRGVRGQPWGPRHGQSAPIHARP